MDRLSHDVRREREIAIRRRMMMTARVVQQRCGTEPLSHRLDISDLSADLDIQMRDLLALGRERLWDCPDYQFFLTPRDGGRLAGDVDHEYECDCTLTTGGNGITGIGRYDKRCLTNTTDGGAELNEQQLFRIIRLIADNCFDGHFTMMKFTTNWCLEFGTPESPIERTDIDKLPVGGTLLEAFVKAIESADWPESPRRSIKAV